MRLGELPCPDCGAGNHERCTSSLCGCIADHDNDDPTMRGFKRLKRQRQPEREASVKGGWSVGPRRLRPDEYRWGAPIR